MQNKQNKKHIMTAVLASLIVITTCAASVMSGCGCDDNEEVSNTSGTTTIVETSIETKIVEVDGTTSATTSDGSNAEESGNDKSESSGSSQSSGGSQGSSGSSQSSGSNSSSSKSGSSSGSSSKTGNNSASSKSSSSSNNTSKSSGSSSKTSSSSKASSSSSSKTGGSSSTSSKKLSIGGKSYSVGDTVTAVYSLKTPTAIVNYQGYVKYDSSYLKVESAELSKPAASNGIINEQLENKIKCVGSRAGSGYNYTNGGTFLTVTFKVKKGGSTSTDFVWEVCDSTGNPAKEYVTNGKPVSGLKMTVAYS